MTVSSRSRLIAGGGAAVLAVVLGLGLAGCPGDSVAATLPSLTRARLAEVQQAFNVDGPRVIVFLPAADYLEVGLEAKLPELRARLAATRLAPTR
jgi:hypothetical protein